MRALKYTNMRGLKIYTYLHFLPSMKACMMHFDAIRSRSFNISEKFGPPKTSSQSLQSFYRNFHLCKARIVDPRAECASLTRQN